ncbi:hypothetical protein BDV37DRAFT_249126 [Aspergillus pseudonomiae]|uniref:Uncharacterized protein n=1 Tax=Aspergillus pseudonomiae TaxID=1506151 RepID=A0A5N7DBK2_9EURO|nr:uncharacterized protein BDV37DRAFT_249126 [Aspergillus pseudonomiae]KAE8403727.1 hypothetical protein BDV37DRAFT_249126 [Aspergillus pseudonomiae]
MLQSLLAGHQPDFECSGSGNIPNQASREHLFFQTLAQATRQWRACLRNPPHICGHVLVFGRREMRAHTHTHTQRERGQVLLIAKRSPLVQQSDFSTCLSP